MVKAIREAGREPVQRNTFYEPLKIWNGETPAAPDQVPRRGDLLQKNLATA